MGRETTSQARSKLGSGLSNRSPGIHAAILSFLLAVFFVFATHGFCADLYVDPTAANDDRDGLSWETAKKTLYGAYTAAKDGDKIHLKNTVHLPLTQNLYITKNLYWVNENDDIHFEQCIVQPSDHALKIYQAQNSFTGITFKGGSGSGNIVIGHGARGIFSFCSFSSNKSSDSGGAILIAGDADSYAEGRFHHCKFASNSSDKYGGAIGGARCIVTCDNCSFSNNSASAGGAAVSIGIYYSDPPSRASFNSCYFWANIGGGQGAVNLASGEYSVINCRFEDNKAIDEDSIGGALSCHDRGADTNIQIRGCAFLGNESKGDGGAVRIANSYGAYASNLLTYTISDCYFYYNRAKNGGGLHCGRESGGVVSNCVFSHNEAYRKNAGGLYNSGTVRDGGWMIVTYSQFHQNKAQMHGGGMYIAEYPWTIVRNCTFYENTAGIDGDQIGGKSHASGLKKAILVNSIFWGSGENNQISGRNDNTYEAVAFCCFPENKLNDGGAAIYSNVHASPDFIDIADANLRLKPNSPCIDRGTDIGLEKDLDYKPVPIGANVDIGAYEFLNHIGRPAYTPAQDAGYYLWQDAVEGGWHLRFSGDSLKTYHYAGTISANYGFNHVVPFSYEDGDQLAVNENTINFDTRAGAGEDGIRFSTPRGARVSFELYVDGGQEPSMLYIGQAAVHPGRMPLVLLSVGGAENVPAPGSIGSRQP